MAWWSVFPRLRHLKTNTIAPKLNDIPAGICIACRALGHECYRLLQMYSRAFFDVFSSSLHTVNFHTILRNHTSRLNSGYYEIHTLEMVQWRIREGSDSQPKGLKIEPCDCAVNTRFCTNSHRMPFCLASRTFFCFIQPCYKLERTVQISARKTNPRNFAKH